MNSFVNIKSFFQIESERTIEKLASLYKDKTVLISAIEEIISVNLKTENIKGKKILLKPNWVKHNTVPLDEICLRTHDQFLLAALEVVLRKSPSSVIIGDAPIQGCKWSKMISQSFINEVIHLSNKYKVLIDIIDFRRVTFDPSLNNPIQERRPLSDYIIFDVGKESFLEPISKNKKKIFRVTNYNPDRLAESHGPGMHKYCITTELFNADVVISLPKVKTHQKAGITAALKNIVGLNGDKDYLPHHRLGGAGKGGDCYPGNNMLRYWSELALDNANRNQGRKLYWFWRKLSSLLWRSSIPGAEHHLSAAWHGNDTTWRMVLDLNKIVIYGKKDGTLASTPQRQLFSLCDGIIGGQGDGPLRPEPLALGVISFTNNSGLNDIAMATLMGFDIDKIPLLHQIAGNSTKDNVKLCWNNQEILVSDLNKYSVSTVSPPGWMDYLK